MKTTKTALKGLIETKRLSFDKFKYYINASSLLPENLASKNIHLTFIGYQTSGLALEIYVYIGRNNSAKEVQEVIDQGTKSDFVAFVQDYINNQNYNR